MKNYLFYICLFLTSQLIHAQQNSTIDCTSGPISTTFCYDTGLDNSYTFTSNDGTPLNLTIDEGQVENNWDEFIVYDSDGATELTPAQPFYGNAGDLTGLTFQSTGNSISLVIDEDGSISCVSSGYNPITFTVSCATCINPSAEYTVINDCENGDQFLIDVNINGIGDAESLTISDNYSSNTEQVTTTGIVQLGLIRS